MITCQEMYQSVEEDGKTIHNAIRKHAKKLVILGDASAN